MAYIDGRRLIKIELTGGGYDEGYTTGKQDEHAAFWDAYQDNGNRTNYARAFSQTGWNDTTFKPKHSIKPINGSNMFANSQITNIKRALVDNGVTLDTSQATNLENLFEGATTEEMPAVSFESAISVKYAFYGAKNCVTIDKLILKADGTNTFQTPFANCTALENIVIDGVIGQNGFYIGYSKKLSRDSITSIINALSNTTSGLAVTLSKAAVNTAFETAADAADGSASAEWLELIATKPNWTISLV